MKKNLEESTPANVLGAPGDPGIGENAPKTAQRLPKSATSLPFERRAPRGEGENGDFANENTGKASTRESGENAPKQADRAITPGSSPAGALAAADGAPVSAAVGRLAALSLAANTRRAYAAALSRWADWLDGRAPAESLLCEYLAALQAQGKSSATAAMVVAAASKAGACETGKLTQTTLAGFRRANHAAGRGQSAGLTETQVSRMIAHAESVAANALGAKRTKAIRDAAMIGVLFHSGLRRSELSALLWSDIRPSAKHPGCVLIHVRRSKTDQTGEASDYRMVCSEPARALAAWRAAQGGGEASRVMPIEPDVIGRRVKALAKASGIEGRVTAHSTRIGMASELTRRGASMQAVMKAGNWQSARMVAHYSAAVSVEDGAVATYFA